MDFTFSVQQRAQHEKLRRALMPLATPELLRELATGEVGVAHSLSVSLSELGVFDLSVPVANEGQGGADLDWALVAQELGYHALPSWLAETAWLGVACLNALPPTPLQAHWLPRIAKGRARLALVQPGRPAVVQARGADLYLLFHANEWHAVEASAVVLQPLSGSRALNEAYGVEWTPSSQTCVARGDPAQAMMRACVNRGALSVALTQLGLAMRMLDLAIDHSVQRKQFGRPVGSFQAIKHALADVAVQIEFAKPLAYLAAYALAHAEDLGAQALDFCISHARLAAGEALQGAARQAQQVHGAVGYCWDFDLHVYLTRGWATETDWGARAFHQARVNEAVLGESAMLDAYC